MSSEASDAIRVDGLGKRYRVDHSRGYRTLRETLTDSARELTGWFRPSNGRTRLPTDYVWALQDITFAVPHGSAIGIIGRNGSGKSTLLKILSRVTEPTMGTAEVRGRVGSLLEVGTGFHPELTGRENVFLSGAILGMRHADIRRRFDAIVEFAEVNRFVDMPVKRYSSGMYLRLAFSVAAHLEPQILLVDEVLAVGDAAFQKKCLGRMGDVAGHGRTVLFVSHNLDAVQRLCATSILLDQGRLVATGPTGTVVRQYLERVAGSEAPPETPIDLLQRRDQSATGVRFRSVSYTSFNQELGSHAYSEGPLELRFEIESDVERSIGSLAVTFETLAGSRLIDADILAAGVTLHLAPGRNVVRFRILALHLNPGTYNVGFWIGQAVGSALDHLRTAFQVEVISKSAPGLGSMPETSGPVSCPFEVTQHP
jgi:ABC-type polysaccharide/polyol phosphate transport system ATPase subunit